MGPTAQPGQGPQPKKLPHDIGRQAHALGSSSDTKRKSHPSRGVPGPQHVKKPHPGAKENVRPAPEVSRTARQSPQVSGGTIPRTKSLLSQTETHLHSSGNKEKKGDGGGGGVLPLLRGGARPRKGGRGTPSKKVGLNLCWQGGRGEGLEPGPGHFHWRGTKTDSRLIPSRAHGTTNLGGDVPWTPEKSGATVGGYPGGDRGTGHCH